MRKVYMIKTTPASPARGCFYKTVQPAHVCIIEAGGLQLLLKKVYGKKEENTSLNEHLNAFLSSVRIT